MRRRRRYEVVVEGLSGHAASQRSVIGEHRSEAEARESAALERDRLEVIYGDAADAWRIVVIRDGEVIAVENPAGAPPPAPEPDPPGPPPTEQTAEEAAQGTEAPEPAAREEWPDMDMSGPVPEWVISRVEESIARRRDRERGEAADAPVPEDPAAG